MKKLANALDKAIGWLIRRFLLVLIYLAFRPKISFVSENARREALKTPTVIVSNHVRGMDGAVIAALLSPDRIHGMVAKDMYKNRVEAWLFRRLQCFPVDRQHLSMDWLRTGRAILTKEHDHVFICPEGRCNKAKVMRRFKPGAATLAVMCHAAILPIYHNGEYHYVFGKRFRCMVGEPITLPADCTTDAQELEEITKRAEEAVRALEQQMLGFTRGVAED